jgi:peptidoglycan/LPS O-acetylase OafA/YrhL
MRWSVAAVGLLLLLGSGAYVVLDSEGPLIDTAEVVLPVLCGAAIVGYGYQLRSGEHAETHVATIALGQVLGALCFAALVGWIVVIQTLDGDVSPEPGYTLVNYPTLLRSP